MHESARDKYRARFMGALQNFDPAMNEWMYYRPGDAWVHSDYVEVFPGMKGTTIRILNGYFLEIGDEEEVNKAVATTVEEFHSQHCVQVGDTWFVNLP